MTQLHAEVKAAALRKNFTVRGLLSEVGLSLCAFQNFIHGTTRHPREATLARIERLKLLIQTP